MISFRSIIKINWLAPAFWSLVILGLYQLLAREHGFRNLARGLASSAALLLACGLCASFNAAAACTASGACLSAGPRLASVDTTKSALLNPLLGGLLGSSLNLTAADWNSLAQGEVNLLGFLTALQVQTNVSTPAQALAANVTLAQVAAALGVQAQAQVNTSLAGHRRYLSIAEVDAPDDVIARVRDPQISAVVDRNALRISESCAPDIAVFRPGQTASGNRSATIPA